MSTSTISRGTTSPDTWADTPPSPRSSPMRRIFGVVARSQSYRNIAYLLLGLPLGTIWFSVLVSGYSVGISMVVVALLGIPVLWAMWYVVRAAANVERRVANVLLGQHLAAAPMASSDRGNVWVRLRSMGRDRDRWRELGYLVLRFPAGIAAFTAAVTALATPAIIAYAPFSARYGGDHPFGEWSRSSRIEDIASNSWSWFLVPLGAVLLIAAFHLLNALARACGRWTAASLDG
jgi:Putative sensor